MENDKCKDQVGSFTLTYAMDEKKRYLVVIKLADITDQGIEFFLSNTLNQFAILDEFVKF